MMGYLSGILEAFYSRDFYRQVGTQWSVGSAALYFLLLTVILWAPATYNMFGLNPTLNALFDEKTDYRGMLSQLPQMTVTNGVLQIDKASPYAVMDPATKKPFIVFDTNDQLTNIEAFPHGVVVHSRTAQVKYKDGQVSEYYLQPNHNFSVDASSVVRFYDMRWAWIAVVILPLMIFFAWCGGLLFSLAYALIGFIAAKVIGAPLGYKHAFVISLVAMTPALVVNSIFRILGYPTLDAWMMIVLTSAFIVFGVIANKNS